MPKKKKQKEIISLKKIALHKKKALYEGTNIPANSLLK